MNRLLKNKLVTVLLNTETQKLISSLKKKNKTKNFIEVYFNVSSSKNYSGGPVEKNTLFLISYKFKTNLKYFYSISLLNMFFRFEDHFNTFPCNLKIKKLLKNDVLKKSVINDKIKFLITMKHCLFIIFFANNFLYNKNQVLHPKIDFVFKKLNFIFFNNIFVLAQLVHEFTPLSTMAVNFTNVNNVNFSKKKRSIKKNRLKKLKLINKKLSAENNIF